MASFNKQPYWYIEGSRVFEGPWSMSRDFAIKKFGRVFDSYSSANNYHLAGIMAG